MVVNVLMTVVATALVDRMGRRTLLIGSLGGMLVSTMGLVGTLFMSEQRQRSLPLHRVRRVLRHVVRHRRGVKPIPWF